MTTTIAPERWSFKVSYNDRSLPIFRKQTNVVHQGYNLVRKAIE